MSSMGWTFLISLPWRVLRAEYPVYILYLFADLPRELFELEYPLQALLREQNPHVQFVHTGVNNASTRYRQPIAAAPRAIVCLECAGDTQHLRLYQDFPISNTAGQFVILTK